MALCSPWFDHATLDCPGDTDPENPELAALVASQLLYGSTGRRWPGLCTDAIVSCPSCWSCTCGHRSCDGERDAIVLPATPVVSITSGCVDGAAITGDLLLEDGRLLLLPAGQTWGADWAIDYTWGALPPEYMVQAARTLACQLGQGWAGGECDLPEEAISATREGLTLAFADPTEVLGGDTYGIGSVDWAVAVANRPAGRARVLHVRDLAHGQHRRIRTITVTP